MVIRRIRFITQKIENKFMILKGKINKRKEKNKKKCKVQFFARRLRKDNKIIPLSVQV